MAAFFMIFEFNDNNINHGPISDPILDTDTDLKNVIDASSSRVPVSSQPVRSPDEQIKPIDNQTDTIVSDQMIANYIPTKNRPEEVVEAKPPGVIVLMSENTLDDWNRQIDHDSHMPKGNLNAMLKEKGFRVMDADMIKGEYETYEVGDIDSVIAAAKEMGVLVLVYGQVEIQDEGLILNSRLHSFIGQLTLSAVRTDTREILSTANAHVKQTENSLIAAKSKIYQRLLNNIGDDWVTELANKTITKQEE